MSLSLARQAVARSDQPLVRELAADCLRLHRELAAKTEECDDLSTQLAAATAPVTPAEGWARYRLHNQILWTRGPVAADLEAPLYPGYGK